jgi:hypothetical protein
VPFLDVELEMLLLDHRHDKPDNDDCVVFLHCVGCILLLLLALYVTGKLQQLF